LAGDKLRLDLGEQALRSGAQALVHYCLSLVQYYVLSKQVVGKRLHEKGTEGLNFEQLLFVLARAPALHLSEFDAVTLFDQQPEPVIAHRLAVMCRLAHEM